MPFDFFRKINVALIPVLREIVQGKDVESFAEKVEEIKIPPDLLQAYKSFLEHLLKYLGKEDFKVNEKIIDLHLAQWLVIGVPACICIPQPCPCEEFIKNNRCVCKLFVKKEEKKKK